MKRGETIEQGEGWKRIYETHAKERVVFEDGTPDMVVTASEFTGEDGQPYVLPPQERGDFEPAVAQHRVAHRATDDRERAEVRLREALPKLRKGGVTENVLADLIELGL